MIKTSYGRGYNVIRVAQPINLSRSIHIYCHCKKWRKCNNRSSKLVKNDQQELSQVSVSGIYLCLAVIVLITYLTLKT